MPPFSAAKRRKNVATAEGRGKHLTRKAKPRQGRKTVALEESFAPAGAMSGCECQRDSAQPSKIGFAQTETTAFSRGYILAPRRGSFRLIPKLAKEHQNVISRDNFCRFRQGRHLQVTGSPQAGMGAGVAGIRSVYAHRTVAERNLAIAIARRQ